MTRAERIKWLGKELNILHDKELWGDLPLKDQEQMETYTKEYQTLLAEIEQEEKAKKADKSREMKQRRGRGHYGESRLAKKVNGIVVGRSKYIVTDKGGVQINPNKPPDVIGKDGMFSYESKWLKKVPKMMEKVMTQAITNAPKDFIPVGVIGDRLGRVVYYTINEKDWIDLHIGQKEK